MARRTVRRALGVIALMVGASTAASQGPVASAASGSLSAKRKEAARIEAQLEATQTRLSELDEEYNQARLSLARAKEELTTSSAELSQVQTRLVALRASMRELAMRALTTAPGESLESLDGTTDINDFERRVTLEATGGAGLGDLADRLRAEQEDLARATTRRKSAQERAAKNTASLAKQRREADALTAKLERLNRSVKGELAVLVAEEAQRRAAAEARAAQAALASRQAAARSALERERARQRALAQGASTRGSSGARVETGGVSSKSRTHSLEIDAGVGPAVAPASGAGRAVQIAMAQIGKPYVWGAEGPGGFDCSGLMLYAWRSAGRSLPHSSRSQYSSTTRVSISALQPGDLVFFGSPIHHVGMYIGGGNMVEASRRGVPVRVRTIYRRDLVGAGRVS